MRINTTEKVSEVQRWAMFLRWKKAILVMWLLWWSNISWLSKKLPILWVYGAGEPSVKGEAELVEGFGEGCEVSNDYVQFFTVQLKTVFILKKGPWLQRVP